MEVGGSEWHASQAGKVWQEDFGEKKDVSSQSVDVGQARNGAQSRAWAYLTSLALG